MVHEESEPVSESEDSPTHRPGMLSNLRIVSLLTMGSRVFGLLRDIGMAALFGNGVVLDSFSVAFRIPNLARGVLGEGALSTAFLPAFLAEKKERGQESANRLASTVLSVLALGLSVIVAGCVLTLVAVLVFAEISSSLRLLLGLTAVIFPYIILICSAAQVNAILHAEDRFFWPALTPILLNIVWLTAVLIAALSCDSAKSQIYLIAVALLCGGVIQLVAPLPALRQVGFRYSGINRESFAAMRSMFRGMLPIILGLSISQLNAMCDSFIAWFFAHYELLLPMWTEPPVTSGTASALYFGQRMYQFPLGVFGVALGTVFYPQFTRHAQNHDYKALRRDFAYGLRLIAVIGIPATAGLVMLAEPITRALFQHGSFDAEDSRQTSRMIAAYGTAVWAFIAILIVHRGFYAMGDRMTPVKVGLVTVALNLGLNFVLMIVMGGVGLAYATAIASMFQAIAIYALFERKIGAVEKKRLQITILKTLAATCFMVMVGVTMVYGIDFGPSSIARLGHLVIAFLGSAVTYVSMGRLLGLHELTSLISREQIPTTKS